MGIDSAFRRRRNLLRAASVIAAAPFASPARGNEPARRTALVVGDSLSAEYGLRRGAGWVELLARRLAERTPPWAVVNASISGDTTAGGRTRLGPLLSRHKPALVVIELGGNDALRGLDLAATETNLRAMAAAARQTGARVLLLGMMLPPNFGADYGRRFQSIYGNVAKSEGTALVPFFLDGIAERLDLFQADRIHPTEAAQPRLLDNVWPVLSRLL